MNISPEQARKHFPAGLKQPEDCLRFGLDALLLASFASLHGKTLKSGISALELGCGCGGALFAFALDNPCARCTGLEREKALIDCARENARVLGLENQCIFYQMTLPAPIKKKYDVVMANPPWRLGGRISPKALRARAMWAQPESMAVFLDAGAKALKGEGIFCLIIHPESLPPFFESLARLPLTTRLLLPVSPRQNQAVSRILILLAKKKASRLLMTAPLVLHQENSDGWSETALNFCQWLNPQKENRGASPEKFSV